MEANPTGTIEQLNSTYSRVTVATTESPFTSVAQAEIIRTYPVPNCYLCGSLGRHIYKNLTDRLFNTPGEWNFKKCCNNDCGLLWLDPMPVAEDLPKAYRQYFTHANVQTIKGKLGSIKEQARLGYLARRYGYCADAVSGYDKAAGSLFYLSPRRRSGLDFGFEQLKGTEKGRLLEIGCGSGNLMKTLQAWGWRVEGIDFDAAAVENARSNGLSVRNGDLESQRYMSDSFDAIAMSHVIEHLPNPKKVIEECHRILKPQGRLVIATPNTNAFGFSFFKSNWRGLEPPRHLYIYNCETLSTLTRNAGFDQVNIITGSRLSYGMNLAAMSMRQGGNRDTLIKPSARIRLYSTLLEWLQRFVWLFNRRSGEEIIMVAHK